MSERILEYFDRKRGRFATVQIDCAPYGLDPRSRHIEHITATEVVQRKAEFFARMFPNPLIDEATMSMPNRNPNAHLHSSGKAEFFCILCLGSSYPVTQTFDTAEAAWEVASEMASKNDGSRFFVMKALGSAMVEKPVVRRVITAATSKSKTR